MLRNNLLCAIGLFVAVVLAVGSIDSGGSGDSSGSKEASKRELSMAERYPGPWRTDFNLDITKALAQNNVRGCGEYKYRPSAVNRGEYLVNCTSDGRYWSSYLVWVPLNKVMGPYTPDPTLGN